MNTAPPEAQRYLSEVDSLRALAVVSVLLYHLWPSALPHGYLGVDAFFVISGFVITRRYWSQLGSGTITRRGFLLRRLRRLGAPLAVCVVVTVPAAYAVLEPPALVKLGHSLWTQALSLQNVAFWLQGTYFSSAAQKPLLHTWSLAVEEQFYLLFALLVPLLWRRVTRQTVFLAVLALLSLSAAYVIANRSPSTAFFWLPTRAWQILAGVLCARLLTHRLPRAVTLAAAKDWARASLLLLIIGCLAVPGPHVSFPGARELLLVAAVAALLACMAAVERPWPVLRWPPAVYVGTLSYSLYLTHWPMIALTQTKLGRPLSGTEGILVGLCAIAAAVAIHHAVEDPVRRGDYLRSPRALVGATAATFSLLACMGVALHKGGAGLWRHAESDRVFYRAAAAPVAFTCRLYQLFHPGAELCPVTRQRGPNGILIVGDSIAKQYATEFGRRGAFVGRPVYISTRYECDPGAYAGDGYCGAGVLAALADQTRELGVTDVVLAARWRPRVITGDSLTRQARKLTPSGARLWLVATPPQLKGLAPLRQLQEDAVASVPLNVARRRHEPEMRLLREAADNLAAELLMPSSALCADGVCPALAAGQPLYRDAMGHLTPAGVDRAGHVFRPIFHR